MFKKIKHVPPLLNDVHTAEDIQLNPRLFS